MPGCSYHLTSLPNRRKRAWLSIRYWYSGVILHSPTPGFTSVKHESFWLVGSKNSFLPRFCHMKVPLNQTWALAEKLPLSLKVNKCPLPYLQPAHNGPQISATDTKKSGQRQVTLVILALEKLRQEKDQEFKASLSYMGCSQWDSK